MIKITVIIILILLLIITIYSYYCLSSSMIDYEKDRLEYILKKEIELNNLEKKIKIISHCNEKNEKYQEAIKNINNIIENLNLPPGSICNTNSKNINQENVRNLKNFIASEPNFQSENIKIYNEIPYSENYLSENEMNFLKNNLSESENYLSENEMNLSENEMNLSESKNNLSECENILSESINNIPETKNKLNNQNLNINNLNLVSVGENLKNKIDSFFNK